MNTAGGMLWRNLSMLFRGLPPLVSPNLRRLLNLIDICYYRSLISARRIKRSHVATIYILAEYPDNILLRTSEESPRRT